MLVTLPLPAVPDAGDKARGLLELVGAGLPIPQTLVVTTTAERGRHDAVVGPEAVLAYLGASAATSVIVRPSLKISRASAPGVSGLYASQVIDGHKLEQLVAAMATEDNTQDRASELALLGQSRASSGLCLLLQRFAIADWSGVAHVRADGLGVKVECGIVEGHLSALVDGAVEGWQCELAEVELAGQTDVALVAKQDDMEKLTDLPNFREGLADLYRSLRTLRLRLGEDREVEWAHCGGTLVWLQSQPITETGHNDA